MGIRWSRLWGMTPHRTRRSAPLRPLGTLSAALLLCALLATGCAPHRRGPLPPVDSRPGAGQESTPRPAVDAVTPDPRTRPAAPPPAADTPVGRICALAESFLGVPYRWGGSTPRGFDCSGLVQYVYREAGVNLPRRSTDQSRTGRRADLDDLKPGDLIFFRIDRNVVSHVGISVGGGEFIHAPGTGKTVRRDSLESEWWRRRVMGVRRYF